MSASSNILQFPIAQPGWVEVVVTKPAPVAKPPEPIDLGMLPPEPSRAAELAAIAHIVLSAAAGVSVVALVIMICIGAH